MNEIGVFQRIEKKRLTLRGLIGQSGVGFINLTQGGIDWSAGLVATRTIN